MAPPKRPKEELRKWWEAAPAERRTAAPAPSGPGRLAQETLGFG
ncbi:hypothetical protein ACFVZE_23495 [Streptomyces anulatus]|nr:hypothetical protein OG865_39945 [Streptomyces anulatus]